MDPIEPNASEAIEPSPGSSSVTAFQDLDAPEPTDPTPPVLARWLGFLAVAVCGLLGGLIGYGTGDLMGTTQIWPLGGLVVGAATAAIGIGIIVNLTLQAMNEWDTTSHPEAKKSATTSRTRRIAADAKAQTTDKTP